MPLLLALLLSLAPSFVAAGPPPSVTVLSIDGPISPAAADYFARGLERARENGSALVVLELDTPGGLDTAMRDIVKEIVASPVPVATFVYPGGARAASAGTYILYASHVAAMAPGTNLGAATPIRIGLAGPESTPLPPRDSRRDPQRAGPATGPGNALPAPKTAHEGEGAPAAVDTLAAKQVHDAAAYLRSLAQLRGRNAEWAERAVREAASLSAREALDRRVVDFVASDVRDLLAQAQGRRVDVRGSAVTLELRGAEPVRFEPGWRTRLLSVIASPSLALVLMTIGIYGLVFEFSNPGFVLPGVVGGICLLLALFALQMLPLNFTGLGLIALGLLFLVAEAFVPTSGALGVGGAIALAIGAAILVDTDEPGFGVPLPLTVALAGASALFVFVVVRLGVRSRRARVVTGAEGLAGSVGQVLDDADGEGWATVHGELWRVRSASPLRRGQTVRVRRVDGLTLDVEPEPVESQRRA